jgi:hypothetical protein
MLRRSKAFRLAALIVLIAGLTGCLLELENPELEIGVEPAMNDDLITIPYRVFGAPAGSTLRWELYFNDGFGNFVFGFEQSVRVYSNDSGLLELGYLNEAQYQIIFNLETSRGTGTEVVPSLTRSFYFYVDRTPPATNAVPGDFSPIPGTTLSVATDQSVGVSYFDPTDPNFESPQRVLVAVDTGIRPPIVGVDELDPSGSFRLWRAGEYVSPATIQVTWVVVDEAGNRSSLSADSYTGGP